MATHEITIRGAGIFGLSIAWACHLKGARVHVIDPAGPGAGASGGIVGALAPHVPEAWNDKKAFQLDSLLMAGRWWAEIDRASETESGYAQTGRIQPVVDPTAEALARRRVETAAALWRGVARWELCPASDFPGWVTPGVTMVVHDTLSARLHPRRACESLAAALARAGVPVTPDGPERGAIIHATGDAGLRALSAAFDRPVGSGVKGQAALLEHAAAGAPQVFVDGLHVVPHADGTTAIGSTSERDFADGTSTDAALDDIIDRIRAAVPALADAPVRARWAGIRPRARSRAPMLGPWPGRPGHFVANGGFKIGFGMAPRVAEVMAALVLDGRDEIPAAFRVEASL